MPLYREGLIALVGAGLAAVEGRVLEADIAGIHAAWAALDRIWPKLCPGRAIGEFRLAHSALCEPAALDAPAPAGDVASAVCSEAACLVLLLERAIEPRTPRRLAGIAAVRTAGPVLALSLATWMLARSLLEPTSLALHRPVRLSSTHPASRALPGELVNGRIEFTYGAHTDIEDDPWIVIDLAQPVRIGKIVVYNRGDCCFSDVLPLIVEAGDSESSFRQVAVRNAPFSRTRPWVIDRLDVTARYLRLRKTGHTYIGLSEVSVYPP
jgi:hypothetical protein